MSTAAPEDDDDMSAYWRDVREARQEKRASNREDSAAMLREAGISFVAKNAGAHLIVTWPSGIVDFWPGTGLWTPRGSKHQRRGVRKLIEYLSEGRT